MSAVVVSVAPAAEPVTLAQAKLHLRISGSDEDTLISALISAAREKLETDTRRALVQQTRVLYLDSFYELDAGGEIWLPGAPLASVSSVRYEVSGSPSLETVDAASYRVDTASEPGRISLAYSASWPGALAVRNAIQVTYVCGYAPDSGSPIDYAANVPKGLKQAILLLVGAWYEHREAIMVLPGLTPVEVPMAYESLMWQHRVLTF